MLRMTVARRRTLVTPRRNQLLRSRRADVSQKQIREGMPTWKLRLRWLVSELEALLAVKHRKKLNMKMLKINNRVLNCRIAPITNQNKRKRTKMPKHKTKLRINNRVLNCRIAPITNQNKRKRTKMPKHKTKLRIKIPHKKKCRKFKDNWLCFNRIKWIWWIYSILEGLVSSIQTLR